MQKFPRPRLAARVPALIWIALWGVVERMYGPLMMTPERSFSVLSAGTPAMRVAKPRLRPPPCRSADA